MSDAVAQSFAHLVKTNNGLFKSPAQAQFLLSQCRDGEYVTGGSTYGNGYSIFYICDQQGVTRVQKQTVAKGLVTQWERQVEGTVSLQDAREIKRLTRKLKQTQKEIADREVLFNNGQYNPQELYQWAQRRDQDSVLQLKQMLTQLGQLT